MLFTPRPLGPIYDIAYQSQSPLRTLLEGITNRAALDLIKFLSRRIHRTSVMLILTYRDDELRKEHPLRLLLG